MWRRLGLVAIFAAVLLFRPTSAFAQILGTPQASPTTSATVEPSISPTSSPTQQPSQNLTTQSEESLGELERLLNSQEIGSIWPFNPVKYAIRFSIFSGIDALTIVLLLLLPVVALTIAIARHVLGVRGFGIFLPAALSVVFLETGPLIGILLFVVIASLSTFIRIAMRRIGLKLQYLPRMSLVMWFVVLGVLATLFVAPLVPRLNITSISIFPILILILLSEDFTKIQLGKNARVAISITTETVILGLVSYIVLTTKMLQEFAILHPELFLVLVALGNFALGRYSGLRLRELWRFRGLLADK